MAVVLTCYYESMLKKVVFCTFQQAGMHHWPDAPEEHEYLRSPHRHNFHVRVEVAVGGLNRDVEFILLKHHAHDAFIVTAFSEENIQVYPDIPNFGARSCEMIAVDLRTTMQEAGNGYSITAIEVSEDGENGARLEWPAS